MLPPVKAICFSVIACFGLAAAVAEETNNPPPPPPQVATTNLMKIPNWGTDILHYFVREGLTNTGALSNANGFVDFREQHQGGSHQWRFLLQARKLAPANTYTLWSLLEGETNYAEVADFNSDANGSAQVRYHAMRNGNAAAKGKGPPPGKGPNAKDDFPTNLVELTKLTGLAVTDTNDTVLLGADLTQPDRLHYLVKRKLVNEPVGALLQVQGTATRTHFRLQVLNLLPTNSYWLALNDVVVSTNSTDSKGRLHINTMLLPTNSPLELKSVSLLDNTTNVLLHTTLPK